MRYFVTIGDREIEVDLTGATPIVDGTAVHAELAAVPGASVRHLLADGQSHAFTATRDDTAPRWAIAIGAERLTADVVDERTRAIREMTGASAAPAEQTIIAPMPGLVVRIEVEVGQRVKPGQGVVIVEAMKMENELKAMTEGVVAEIRVQPGQTVEKGAVLLVME